VCLIFAMTEASGLVTSAKGIIFAVLLRFWQASLPVDDWEPTGSIRATREEKGGEVQIS